MSTILINDKEAFDLLKYLRVRSENGDIDNMGLCHVFTSSKGRFIGLESHELGLRYIAKDVSLKTFTNGHYDSMIFRDVYNMCVRHMKLV